jgi:beta-glucanase (GH16 family)
MILLSFILFQYIYCFDLVWSDNFDQPVNSQPSPKNWNYETGVQHQNDELEYYTNSLENSFITTDKDAEDGKVLVIRALRKVIQTGNITTNFTSARINTKGLYKFRYGKIECRAKVPKGDGIWPAFWTLGL